MKTTLLLPFVILSIFVNCRAQTNANGSSFSENPDVALSIHLTCYNSNNFDSVISRVSSASQANDFTISLEKATWNIKKRISIVKDVPGAYNFEYTFVCASGQSPETSVSVDFSFENWSVKNYVLMPAAVYGGNRVKSIRRLYVPFIIDDNEMGIDKPQIISDVPRLNYKSGLSRIQQRSGDMSTPAIGFHNPQAHQGFWLLTDQASVYGDNGIDIAENDDRTKATITLTAPVVRERYQYFIADMQSPSRDKPGNFNSGDSVQIRGRVYFFSSPNIQSLYNKFSRIRNALIPKGQPPTAIPFSASFEVQEEKFNRQNFEPKFGYYSVGLRENYFQDWQIGWVGGMISTYPLLIGGTEQTRKNVVRNFDWLFPSGISPSGFFWDSGEKGNKWFGIFQMFPQAKDLHLIRKSCDALYYILRQFELFKQLKMPVKKSWEEGTQTVADALVKTWRTHGQLGQYVHNITGEIVIGGSTSGGIAPAGLVLASRYFNNPEYKSVAEQLATHYYENYVVKGVTYGGPGDALQNFDSESAYGLLESFTVLYEETGDKKWLTMAEDMAIQFATWISSYDYAFPVNSTLGRLGKKTTGVVWANTQNKHGAPGICTHSGAALLRLYRDTGNTLYIDLLRDIAKAIPQYLSTNAKPIPGLQVGWVSERVSTTDWLEGIGQIMNGSTWAETSLLLTSTEIPGIYVDLKNKLAIAFDQVEITNLKSRFGRVRITITNPTEYDAKVRILAESRNQMLKPFHINSYLNWKIVNIPKGKAVTVKLN